MTSVEKLIATLDRAAADPRLPAHVRAASKRDADGYRKAWAAKQAQS